MPVEPPLVSPPAPARCSDCGAIQVRGATFCGQCGKPYPDSVAVAAKGPTADTRRLTEELLQLKALPPQPRWLTIVGLTLLIAGCSFTALLGLKSQIEIAPGVSVAVPIFWGMSGLFIVGGGYVLAAVLATSSAVRWPALVIVSTLLVIPDISVVGTFLGQTSDMAGALGPVLEFMAPKILALSVVWLIAIYRAGRRASGVGVPTVVGCSLALALLFGLIELESLRLTGSAYVYGKQPLLELFIDSSIIFGPVYVLAGIDLAEVLLLGARTSLHIAERQFRGRFGGLALALAASLAAIGTAVVTRPSAFRQPVYLLLFLAYSGLWALTTYLLLRAAGAKTAHEQEPPFPVLLAIVGAGYAVYQVLASGGALEALFASWLAIGSVCILIAVGLLIAGRPVARNAALILGVCGIWLVFQNLSRTFSTQGLIRNDFQGAMDVLLFSAIALIAISWRAQRHAHLIPLRTVATVWTLALVLIRIYASLVASRIGVPEVVATLQVVVLLVILGLGLRAVPGPARLGAVIFVLALFGVSLRFAVFGGPVGMVLIAQTAIFAIAVVWDVMRSGKRLTNRDGRFWPRESRVIGYLGFAMVSVAVGLMNTAAGEAPPPSVYQAVGLILLGVPVVVYLLYDAWRRAGEVVIAEG